MPPEPLPPTWPPPLGVMHLTGDTEPSATPWGVAEGSFVLVAVPYRRYP